METVLLVITLISVATAVVALASARRLRRHERERSEARVAALAAAAETHGAHDGGWTQVAGEWQWTASTGSGFGIRDERCTRESLIPNPKSLISASASSGSERFFGTVERDEPSGNRLPIFAAAALIVMLGGALVFLNTSTSSDQRGDRRTGRITRSRSSSSRSDMRAKSAC